MRVQDTEILSSPKWFELVDLHGMLPGFKESWGGLAAGQQAGLGGRKLLIAALPWKE